MDHSHEVLGPRYRLRPVRKSDSAFIVALRADAGRARYLHPVPGEVEPQERWFEAYRVRLGDYYFVVEDQRSSEAHGLIGLYGVVPGGAEGEWGRWIVRDGSPAAYESAILILEFGFRVLGLSAVYCRTVAENTRVVSFHDGFGYTVRQDRAELVDVGGIPRRIVEHRMERATWETLALSHMARLQRLADR